MEPLLTPCGSIGAVALQADRERFAALAAEAEVRRAAAEAAAQRAAQVDNSSIAPSASNGSNGSTAAGALGERARRCFCKATVTLLFVRRKLPRPRASPRPRPRARPARGQPRWLSRPPSKVDRTP
jgi:hypothetical protein